jgi:GntR family transcriptional regulator, transcriptional repressor for pyruvate dehydrogenase complex
MPSARQALEMPRTLLDPKPAEGRLRFRAVRRGRVFEEVVRQIQEHIASERLLPGDRLPPERTLADRLQVSRSSLRDAIRMLEMVGLVRSRQGEGTVVCEASADWLLELLHSTLVPRRDLAEVIDVRKMVEPSLAARAARHATPEQIASLEAVVRRQRRKMLNGEEEVEEDSEFHCTIALAAGSGLLRKLVDVLMDLLREARGLGPRPPALQKLSFLGHRRILRAIRLREPRTAQAAMRRHLREVQEAVL